MPFCNKSKKITTMSSSNTTTRTLPSLKQKFSYIKKFKLYNQS